MRPNGRLLVIDACWYLYQYDDGLKTAYDKKEADILEKYGRPTHQYIETIKQIL